MSFTAAEFVQWLADESIDAAVDADAGVSLESIELRGVTLDSRTADANVVFVAVAGERTHGARFLPNAVAGGARVFLVEGETPAAPTNGVMVHVTSARRALAAAARGYLKQFSPTIVGITGSNGKTTTKDLLLASLATKRAGGNPGNLNSGWGLPVAVLGQRGDEEILVLEMGASEPGEISQLTAIAPPTVGCITNVAPAHLEQFESEDAVFETKVAMVEGLPSHGTAVLNRDDARFEFMRERVVTGRMKTFGRHPEADFQLQTSEQRDDGLLVTINGCEQTLPFFGEANGLNVAAACAMAAEFGVNVSDAMLAMSRAELSPHRSRVLHVAGRTVLDDCYNANPASVSSALGSLSRIPATGRRVAVLGSMAELGPQGPSMHREVVREARSLGMDALVAVGDAMIEAQTREWVPVAPWDSAPSETAELGGYLASVSRPGDAFLFKASRSVGLEHAVDSMVQTLSMGA